MEGLNRMMNKMSPKSPSKDSRDSSLDRSRNPSPERSQRNLKELIMRSFAKKTEISKNPAQQDETSEQKEQQKQNVEPEDEHRSGYVPFNDTYPWMGMKPSVMKDPLKDGQKKYKEEPTKQEHQQNPKQSALVKDSLDELGLTISQNPDMPEGPQLSRTEEKSALQNLNNRLAGYIDRVRTLQNENHQLRLQLRTYEEYKQTEITNVTTLYSKQIEELKNALENMNRNCNQLKFGSDGLLQENKDLKEMVTKRDLDLLSAIDRANKLEEELRNLGNKMSREEDERRRTEDQLRNMISELENLRSRLDDARSTLDKEQLKGADLENKCQQIEDELQFKTSVLEKQLISVKLQKENEVSKLDVQLHDEYKDRLQKELQELRHIYDNKMEQNKGDFEIRYEEKIRQLQSELAKERVERAGSVQESKEARARLEILLRKVSDFEEEIRSLNQKTAELMQEREDQRSQYQVLLNSKDDSIKRLNDELGTQIKTSEDLRQVKIALDMEIDVFRSLLDVEEERLDINNKPCNLDSRPDSLLLSKDTTETRTTKINKSPSSESSSSEECVTKSQTLLHTESQLI